MQPGRPSVFTETLMVKIADLATRGKTEEQIAEIVGISRRTLNVWKHTKPGFLLSIQEARKIADDVVVAALFERAVGYSHPVTEILLKSGKITRIERRKFYPPDVGAAKFWLLHRRSSKWRER